MLQYISQVYEPAEEVQGTPQGERSSGDDEGGARETNGRTKEGHRAFVSSVPFHVLFADE